MAGGRAEPGREEGGYLGLRWLAAAANASVHYGGMAIAERLYLEDAKLLAFRAVVTDIREYARRDGVQVWQMALDRTAFYPAGGGQPQDLGVLRARARSGAELSVAVDDVVEDEAGEVWHQTTKPLLAGTEVEGAVDAERRLDHTQQHSGQHLLSAVLAEELGARTVSFHLGEDDATIDVAVELKAEQALLLERLGEVERRVNRLIAGNAPVRVRVVPGEEAQALLASGAVRKLPPREGNIRLVEIAGLDLNACGGTHVESLGEIGAVLLRETERVKKGLRLHFVCGARAVRAARADRTELGQAAAMLSVGGGNVADAVHRLQAEVRNLTKERLRLREEIAGSHAVQLAVEERIEDGLRLVCRKFADRDAEYVRMVATRLLDAVPHTAAVLVSTAVEPATVVIASNFVSGPPRGCDSLLREVLAPYALRGGGTAELAQAQVPEELLDLVIEALVRRLTAR